MHNNKPNRILKRIEEVCNWIIIQNKNQVLNLQLETWTLNLNVEEELWLILGTLTNRL